MTITPTTWAIRVDWTSDPLDDVDGLHLLDELNDLTPHIDSNEDAGHLSATIYLEAATLRQAIATGLQRVETATGVKAAGVEAIRVAEEDRRNTHPVIPDLVGNAEIADMLNVTTQRAAAITARDDFPPAVVTTRAGSLRIRWQVEDWAKTWTRAVGRPRKNGA